MSWSSRNTPKRTTPIILKDYWIHEKQIRTMLENFSNSPKQASTFYFPPKQPVINLNSIMCKDLDILTQRKLTEVLGKSDTGGVIFWTGDKGYLVEPPFPLYTDGQYCGYEFGPLINLLNKERKIGVISLRLGRFALGIYQGQNLISSKSGGRYVKGRHRAGGSSSARFERIREKQKRELFDKVCNVLTTLFALHWFELDRIFLSGERMTLKAFLRSCQELSGLKNVIAERILNIREPSRKALEVLPKEIWKSRIHEFS